MKILLSLPLICLSLLLIPPVFGQQTADKIEVTGLVETPLTLTLTDLQKLPVQTGGPLNIVSTNGEVRKQFRSFKGVLLTDVLNAARIKMASPKDKGKYMVVVRATDGYTTLFSYNELFNNPTGKQVLVLFDTNESPIGEDGAFVLVTTNDLITGARHVKWLNRIEVRKID